MGRYYNKTRTPLAATTRSGGSVCFPSRVWISVPDHEEASSSIMTAVRKGFLAYQSNTVGDVDEIAEASASQPQNDEVTVVANETALKVATSEMSSKTVQEEPAISDSSSIISEVENPEESSRESESDVAYGDGSGTESTAPRKNRRR